MSWITGMSDGRRVAVVVDGSEVSAALLRRAAAQARQRNALLDVVTILPADADTTVRVAARVRLGEFTRLECPYGAGAPVRLRVECGDPEVLLALIGEGAELVLGAHAEALAAPATPGAELGGAADCRQPAPHHLRWRTFLMHEFQA
jgi:nucleotide-binding universal stress UspA family protein